MTAPVVLLFLLNGVFLLAWLLESDAPIAPWLSLTALIVLGLALAVE